MQNLENLENLYDFLNQIYLRSPPVVRPEVGREPRGVQPFLYPIIGSCSYGGRGCGPPVPHPMFHRFLRTPGPHSMLIDRFMREMMKNAKKMAAVLFHVKLLLDDECDKFVQESRSLKRRYAGMRCDRPHTMSASQKFFA